MPCNVDTLLFKAGSLDHGTVFWNQIRFSFLPPFSSLFFLLWMHSMPVIPERHPFYLSWFCLFLQPLYFQRRRRPAIRSNTRFILIMSGRIMLIIIPFPSLLLLFCNPNTIPNQSQSQSQSHPKRTRNEKQETKNKNGKKGSQPS